MVDDQPTSVRLRDRPAPKPWPRRPPAGARCDAQVDCPTPEECAEAWEAMPDPGGTLHVHKCSEPATETCWWGLEAWLCAKHAEEYERLGYAHRNPRRRRS